MLYNILIRVAPVNKNLKPLSTVRPKPLKLKDGVQPVNNGFSYFKEWKMSREVLFRGKDVKTGKFIYGDLVHGAFDGTSKMIAVGIQKPGCYADEVFSETVGQYTGLTDKNGVKMFEGDVIKDEFEQIATILWNNSCAMFTLDYTGSDWDYMDIDVEVIGNIHEVENER